MHERTRWRLIFAGAFLAPMMIVKATELYLTRPMPRQAGAISPAAQPTGVDPAIADLLSTNSDVDLALPGEQQALFAYVRMVHERPLVRSPLEFPTVARDEPTQEEAPAPTPAAPPELAVTIQAVMRSAGGNIALIDGTMYRVGEKISDRNDENSHWIIRDIDPAARSVTFEHSSGTAEEIRSVRQ